MTCDLYLLRHGETEWTLSGRHTGISDIPLTSHGEEEARRAGESLRAIGFVKVFTSPRLRARRTCELAGLGALMEVCEDLHEWDYGDYEGLLPTEIQALHPGWDVFEHGCPNGETPEQVSARADRVIAMIRRFEGKVAVVSHGHFSRALATRWVNLPIRHGHVLDSATASISVLSTSRNSGKPVIKIWNRTFSGA
jgi:probable phosphoglycerate mutase